MISEIRDLTQETESEFMLEAQIPVLDVCIAVSSIKREGKACERSRTERKGIVQCNRSQREHKLPIDHERGIRVYFRVSPHIVIVKNPAGYTDHSVSRLKRSKG